MGRLLVGRSGPDARRAVLVVGALLGAACLWGVAALVLTAWPISACLAREPACLGSCG